jgi:hypothetical protein
VAEVVGGQGNVAGVAQEPCAPCVPEGVDPSELDPGLPAGALEPLSRDVAKPRNSVRDEYPQCSNREGPVTTGNLRCV